MSTDPTEPDEPTSYTPSPPPDGLQDAPPADQPDTEGDES